MRDYKNVTVPKKYRTSSNRVTVKRVEMGRVARGPARGGLKSAALKCLVITVIAAGSWLGWQTYRIITHADMFQIAGVDVKGVRQLGEADLKKIVGSFTGQNIFRVDLDAVVQRARANAWVKSVSIYRRLPNRISMVVNERVPYAFLDTGRGRYLMDSEGVALESVEKDKAQAWQLPTVSINGDHARIGEQVTSEGLDEALMLLSEISTQGGWRLEDVTAKADSSETLSLLYAGHEFKLGNGRYKEKLRRLAEVMADVNRRGLDVAYVDLRPDRQVAVMVKKKPGR
jgi:cell division septal protein FtsQ